MEYSGNNGDLILNLILHHASEDLSNDDIHNIVNASPLTIDVAYNIACKRSNSIDIMLSDPSILDNL